MLRLAAVIGGAVVAALLSWVQFGGLRKGVVISGAGDIGANGYYKWEPRLKSYIKFEVPTRGWRVPDVYDLVSRGPEDDTNSSVSMYMIYAFDDARSQTRAWYLIKSAVVEYVNEGQSSLFDTTPPSTGWAAVGQSNITSAGLEPPPQVAVGGRNLAPDSDPISNGFAFPCLTSNFGGSLDPTTGMPSVSEKSSDAYYPGTALLLVFFTLTRQIQPRA